MNSFLNFLQQYMTLTGNFHLWLWLLFGCWNFIVFLVYGIDKRKAIKKTWRIRERTLLLLAVCMGGIGGFCGMRFFHHKTQHRSFQIIVPLAAILTIVGWMYFITT